MISFYKYILKSVKPIVKFWGKLHLPFTHKSISQNQFEKIKEIVKNGDIFLTSIKGEFSNMINPSDFKHAAIYDKKNNKVIESTVSGVIETGLEYFIFSKDLICIVRPNFGSEFEINQAVQRARKLIGSKYDYEFEDGDNEFYCFEVVAKAYEYKFGKDIFPKKEIVGGFFIYDSDSFTKNEKFQRIYDTRNN